MQHPLLGHKVTDIVTGFKGTCIGVVHYLTGCSQALVAPPVNKEGKRPDGEWFDVQRLKVQKGGPVKLDNGDTPGFDQEAPKR